MATLLLTNDDGIESPTLLPLARGLSQLAEVDTIVPERERSWIGKAITRFEPVQVRRMERDGVALHALSGTPADCVAIGVHGLAKEKPTLVVSGINLGLNFGTAFFLSSGTVGAAIESWIAGVPGVAFSMAIPSDAYGLSGADRAARLGSRCLDAARVAGAIVATLLERGFPAEVDLLSVNMPADVTLQTPRRITGITRSRYGPVFSPAAAGRYVHRFQSYAPLDADPNGDMETVRRGMVSIAPVRLDFGCSLPESLRADLEAGGR